MSSTFQVLVRRVNSFCVQLGYFLSLSFLGFLALKFSKPRAASSVSLPLKDLDVFFTSVSAATVSSMSTVEMEVFSNFQLIVMTILMFGGGEVFISMIGLYLTRSNLRSGSKTIESKSLDSARDDRVTQCAKSDWKSFSCPVVNDKPTSVRSLELQSVPTEYNDKTVADPEKGPVVVTDFPCDAHLKYNSVRCLGLVVLIFLLVAHVLGSSLVTAYISTVPSAREVLRNKGISIQTFSVFTIVSTFANCGFVPTNENMMVFKNNSGILLLLIPHILFGNTLYPTCLRLILQALEKATRREEFTYILRNWREIGYTHLLPSMHSWFLGLTVLVFIVVQLVLFCSMEWRSDVMEGMSPYQKLVGALFQTVNSRHTGESVFDISTISPAILVLFVIMMYLAPYTSFLPIKEGDGKDQANSGRKGRWSLMECLNLSQLSYLIIFIILICITEREKLKTDPLNFNVLNITIEVISAYGNVGFTTGYSCKRQINPDGSCKDAYVGFVGKWSNEGKFILIVVMFFGRLKKFNMGGGKAWKLLA
ncbi:hypothetical protein CDL15_Pgr015961 [Punica granatum]|nr:hypothetical protein CDL15_Pgr015961 [Punica granatum]